MQEVNDSVCTVSGVILYTFLLCLDLFVRNMHRNAFDLI